MQLRDYQESAVSSVAKYFAAEPSGRPLVVAPTGSGKSIIIAEIIRRILAASPIWKILVVTHRKEIVAQNAEAFQRLTGKPVGIVSAGLGQKSIRQITFANIQSIYKHRAEFDVILVDEAHLISGKDTSMYSKLFDLQRRAKIIGLTATPYRMDNGLLVGEGKLFTRICYNIEVTRLIEQGHLVPPISVPTNTVDTEGIRKSGFDFNLGELERVLVPLSRAHAEEILRQTQSRNHVLVFCSSVQHACEMATLLKSEYVSGDMMPMQRDQIINRFKTGQIKYLVNVEILTTGFNFPALDCIVLIRPTQSTGLYVQMIGRCMRTAPGKANALVLDFGGNIKRHGPIDAIQVRDKNKKAEFSIAPVKACSECGCVVAIKVMTCPNCNHAFPAGSDKYTPKASVAPVLNAPRPVIVQSIDYVRHKKEGKPDSLRIKYKTDEGEISEFLCFEHGGYAAEMAKKKWKDFKGNIPYPANISEAFLRAHELARPESVLLKQDGKFHRIVSVLKWKALEVDDLSMPNI